MPVRAFDPVSRPCKQTHSYLRVLRSRSIIRLSIHRLLPCMLIFTFESFSKSIQPPLVNWLPWSVLNISDVLCFDSASFRASTQNAVSMLLESRHAKILRLYESMIATRYRKPRRIGIYVISPHKTLVWAVNYHVL